MRKAAEGTRFGQLFAVFELASILTLILLQIWILQRRSSWGAYLAAILILGGWVARRENLETLGLIGKRYALPIVILFLGKMIFGHLPIFRIHGTGIESIPLRMSMYFLWAIVQQLVLNGFFVNRLQCIADGRYLPVCAGIIFGAVHIPNSLLMPVTAVGGAAASYSFLKMKRKNLYLIALVHAAIGMIILYYLPPSWHHNMVVGPRFYFYR